MAEQPGDQPVVELEAVRQQRRLCILGIGHELEQPAPQERRVECKAPTPQKLFLGRLAQEIEHEVNARAPARYIILEKRIKALITKVKFGGQGDDEDIEVKGIEVERARERGEPGTLTTGRGKMRVRRGPEEGHARRLR